MATASISKLKLKLLIDKNRRKVLFAQAGKDFVDFLFSLMSFPLGSVVRLLSKNHMVGCFGNLYESFETLSDNYLQPTLNKDFILKPKVSMHANIETPLLLPNTEIAYPKMYTCPNLCNNQNYYSDSKYHCLCLNVTVDEDMQCPVCNIKMSSEATVLAPTKKNKVTTSNGGGDDGFVKDVVTYMVMDNLEVKPMSTISSITLINTFKIRDLGSLEEKEVDIGVSEGLELLKVSLQAKNVLTSVFLKA